MFWLRSKKNHITHSLQVSHQDASSENNNKCFHEVRKILPFASSDFCHLLTAFANMKHPDQDWQNVGPDLDQNCLIL